MRLLLFLFFSCFFLGLKTDLLGQAFGFQIPKNQKMVKIPFDYINNFIIIDIKFNDQIPLKFIYDTGAENTLITKREIIDIFGIPLGRTFTVIGSDLKTELTAHLVQGISLSTENIRAEKQDILVLEEDYIDFERLIGMQIHGIAAADLFKRLFVKIDYVHQELVLYKSKPDLSKKYEEIAIEIIKSKPYVKTRTTITEAIDLNTKLLIDTGADMSLLLNVSSDDQLQLPDEVISSNIGIGLGGFLEGYLGRVKSLELGSFTFENIIGSFQEESDSLDNRVLVKRNGIIGNQLLNRFTVMIDYMNAKLYLKPRRKWKKGFDFDRSGFFFIMTDIEKNRIVVQNIIEKSPAYESGFQKGDVIKSINGISTNFLSFNILTKMMSRKPGKKVKIKFLRKGQTMVKTIVLRDIL